MEGIYLGANTEQEFHMLHKATLRKVDNFHHMHCSDHWAVFVMVQFPKFFMIGHKLNDFL